MCGITGFFDASQKLTESHLRQTVTKMTDRLVSRGPDSEGMWCDATAGIALGHRRLAVIDLSLEGHQPMISACKRYVMVFNGEIYNHVHLRARLEQAGCTFRGHSDTEVLLAGIAQWGISTCLQYLNGMFAFVVWDRENRRLLLARDRFGEKPLYYGWIDKTFFFASELKSLAVHPDFKKDINRDALALYLRHNYIPHPHSIFRGISKLTPGSYLSISTEDVGVEAHPQAYWLFEDVVRSGLDRPFKGSETEALEALRPVLAESVKSRMQADVPLGAFLSGGIDSSTVVALMQAQSMQAVKTFSIGFHESAYNEAEAAKKVAKLLGTEHSELYVSPKDALAVIPLLPQIYDEPFGDSSQIPTYLVSKMARQAVTVSLSGDGADELFGGYSRYFQAEKIMKALRWMPKGGRQISSHFLERISELPLPVGKALKCMSEILSVDGDARMYRAMISHVNSPEVVVLGAREPKTIFDHRDTAFCSGSAIQDMMFIDTLSYLSDDLLVKVDRAGMALGLESRIPFLDHRLFELVWQFPIKMNIRKGKGKLLLRKVLSDYLPDALIDRPKQGFGVPISAWLRGPLRAWGEELLDEQRLKSEGWFDPALIRKRWLEHLSHKNEWHYFLWTVLMFQAWLEEWAEDLD